MENFHPFVGGGSLGVDWNRIETDADGKSVGLSAPITYPTDSNDLYTSGWSFGSISNEQFGLMEWQPRMSSRVEGYYIEYGYFVIWYLLQSTRGMIAQFDLSIDQTISNAFDK